MEKNNIPEEVTITPVIRDLERLFLRLLFFVKAILSSLVDLLVALFRLCVKNFVLFSLVTIIGGIMGYYSDLIIPRNYTSTLVVEVSVDASSQLYNDINYVNSLIKRDEFEPLSKLLGISVEEAKTLSEMKAVPFSSQIERLRILDGLYRSLDTTTKRSFDLLQFVNDEDGMLSKRFAISVFGTNPKIFSKLEPSFVEFLERVPELQERRKEKIRILTQQKAFYQKQLDDLDTLKKVNNVSMLREAEKTTSSPSTSISLGGDQSSESLNILEVYNRYNEYQNQIVSIENKLLDLESCYNVYAHFSEHGLASGPGKLKRAALVGGSLFLLILITTSLINNQSSTRESNA